MSIVNGPSGESNSNLNVKSGLMTCRYTAQELVILSEVLELPNPLITKLHYHASALESLALLCTYLCSPDTQWMLVNNYSQTQSAVSAIINKTASFINNGVISLNEMQVDCYTHTTFVCMQMHCMTLEHLATQYQGLLIAPFNLYVSQTNFKSLLIQVTKNVMA